MLFSILTKTHTHKKKSKMHPKVQCALHCIGLCKLSAQFKFLLFKKKKPLILSTKCNETYKIQNTNRTMEQQNNLKTEHDRLQVLPF